MIGRRPAPSGGRRRPGCSSTQPAARAHVGGPQQQVRALGGAGRGPRAPSVRPEGTLASAARRLSTLRLPWFFLPPTLSATIRNRNPHPGCGPGARGSAAACPWGAGVRLGASARPRVGSAGGTVVRSGREAGQKAAGGAPLRLGGGHPRTPRFTVPSYSFIRGLRAGAFPGPFPRQLFSPRVSRVARALVPGGREGVTCVCLGASLHPWEG